MAESHEETYRPAYSRSLGDDSNGDDPAHGTNVDLVPGRTALAVIAFPVLHVGDRLPHPAGLEMPPLLFWGVAGAVLLLAAWLVIDLLPTSGRHAAKAAARDDHPAPDEPLIVGRVRGRTIPDPFPDVTPSETAFPETLWIDGGAEPRLRRHDDVTLVSRDLVIPAGESRAWRPPSHTFLAIAGTVTTVKRDLVSGTVSASVPPGGGDGRLIAWSIARRRSWADPARLLPSIAAGTMGLVAAERAREVQGLASLVRSDNAAQVSRLALGLAVLLLVGAALAIPAPRAAAIALALAGLAATTLAFAPDLADRLRWWDARYVLGSWPNLGWWAIATFVLAGVALLASRRERRERG